MKNLGFRPKDRIVPVKFSSHPGNVKVANMRNPHSLKGKKVTGKVKL